jgi:hypothetical protein
MGWHTQDMQTHPQRSALPWRAGRYVAALALGALAVAINRFPVPLLGADASSFFFGGAFILLAFARLGTGPGILCAVVALSHELLRFDALGFSALLYVVEGYSVVAISRRTDSLATAALAFWFSIGIALDAAIFLGGLRLPLPYVAILFVQQVFNGLLNAVFAELLMVVRLHGQTRARGGRHVSFDSFVFHRIATLVMVPVTFLALLYTQTALTGRVATRQQEASTIAGEIRRALSSEAEKMQETVASVAIRAQLHLARSDSAGHSR